MADNTQSSRRDFLAASAKVAAVAGLMSGTGCAVAKGPKLKVVAGPTPKPVDSSKPVRLGFVGVGARGWPLLNRIMIQPNVTVKAIADPDEPHMKRALDFLKQKNVTPDVYTGTEDYRDKLLARDDIDAVVLATPCYLHGEMYLNCFAAGKHFYGEKPMCIEVNEADALVEAQKKNPKVVAQIGFQRRANPHYIESIQKIHEGMIGDPVDVRARWNHSRPPLGLPSGGGTRIWMGRRKLSGDWMMEQACHTWDVLCWVADAMPVAAYGMGKKGLFKDLDPERDVTDCYFAHLEFPNGMLVDFEHSWLCPPKAGHRFEGVNERFCGRKGGIDPDEAVFFPTTGGEPVALPSAKAPARAEGRSLSKFLLSVRTGRKPISGVENGRMATLTGLLVRKAVDERRRVTMKEFLG